MLKDDIQNRVCSSNPVENSAEFGNDRAIVSVNDWRRIGQERRLLSFVRFREVSQRCGEGESAGRTSYSGNLG